MGKKIKYGKLPVNAAISIDYTGEEPKVKFKYPRKDAAAQNAGLIAVPLVLLFFLLFTIFIASADKIFPDKSFYPTTCNFTEDFDNKNQIRNISFLCDNGLNEVVHLNRRPYKNPYYNYAFNLFEGNYLVDKNLSTSDQLKAVALFSFIFIIIVIIVPVLIEKIVLKHLVKVPYFQRKIPKIQEKVNGGRGYSAVFKEVPKSLYIEIPLFHNVRLDYHATKDFSKYLTKFEIEPHPFDKVSWKGKKRKKVKNVSLWYARFYFSNEPKTGKLEVFFK